MDETEILVLDFSCAPFQGCVCINTVTGAWPRDECKSGGKFVVVVVCALIASRTEGQPLCSESGSLGPVCTKVPSVLAQGLGKWLTSRECEVSARVPPGQSFSCAKVAGRVAGSPAQANAAALARQVSRVNILYVSTSEANPTT